MNVTVDVCRVCVVLCCVVLYCVTACLWLVQCNLNIPCCPVCKVSVSSPKIAVKPQYTLRAGVVKNCFLMSLS